MAATKKDEVACQKGYVDLPDSILDGLTRRKAQNCYVEVYSTTCSEYDLSLISGLMSTNGNSIILAISEVGSGLNVVESKIAVEALDGCERLHQYDVSRLVLGRQIILCVPMQHGTSEWAATNKIMIFVALLRLIFGDQIARQRNFSCQYELKGGNWVYRMASPSMLSGPSLFYGDLVSSVIDFTDIQLQLDPAAATILSFCNSETHATTRFILLWIALEAQLNKIPGKTSGLRRKTFFEEAIASTVINAEVKRLYGLRSEIFKSGVSGSLRLEDEFSLLCALRLTALPECVLRQTLAEIYERRIKLIEKGDLMGNLPRYFRCVKTWFQESEEDE